MNTFTIINLTFILKISNSSKYGRFWKKDGLCSGLIFLLFCIAQLQFNHNMIDKNSILSKNKSLDNSIACEIVQISAGDHGPISDQPFSIKNLYFLSKLQIKRFEIGKVIKIISHFNRFSSTLSFEPQTAFYKLTLCIHSGILFEFEDSKLNVLLNLLKWLIVLITCSILNL